MKKTLSLLLFSMGLVTLSSCLKDGAVNLAPGASPAVVEWSTTTLDYAPSFVPITTTKYAYTVYTTAFDIQPSASLNLQVGYTGGVAPSSDITVTLDTNPADIANFNTEQGTGYVAMDASLYTMPATVTIPAGSFKASVPIKVNTAGFDLSKKYVIPVRIKSTSNGTPVSGNFGTIYFAVNAKNKFDGNYNITSTGGFKDLTLGAPATGYYPLNSDLVTTSANTVFMYCYTYLGGYPGHPFLNNGGASYYGNFAPIFTIDLTTGAVTAVTNYYGQGTNSSVRSARLDPSGINKYDLTTKVMNVSYIMVQGGNDRTFFNETWTYVAARK